MIITIDGPSGTGKSTVARALAEKLGFAYFDTGAMYRAFTYTCMEEQVNYHNAEALEEALANFSYDIRIDGKNKSYIANGRDVTEAIRSQEVTLKVSEVAAIAAVRVRLVGIQKEYGQGHDAVFEGRDLGTVVFPKAELKVFLTASAKVRAERRYRELISKGVSVDIEQLEREMTARDANDSEREVSPLRQADDAHLVDTSDLSIGEVVSSIVDLMPEVASD